MIKDLIKLTATICGMVLLFQNVLGQSNDSITSGSTFQKYRIGGYGEFLYQHMDYGPDRYNYIDGAQPDNRGIIDIPRAIFAFNYRLRKDILFTSEIEFEHGGTGSALELEYEEMGEYEMEIEKAGEVVLEEIHITKSYGRGFNLRFGHMIVPVGITNTYHLPIQFFGSARPEGENNILPLTWHETGIAVLGKIRKWSYQFQLINGLDANGFSSAYWVNLGKQSAFETTKMTNPAVTGRIESRVIKNLRLSVSGYYGNSAKNTAKPEKMKLLTGTVSIGSFDFEFNNKKLIARGNVVYGDLSDSYEISRINRNISKNIQYPRTPVAKNALTYSFEVGFDVLSFFKTKEKLYPFLRYEYYNSMEATVDEIFADSRYKRNVVTAGINYFISPNLVLKVDYSQRIIDNEKYNTENTIGVTLGYSGWFVSK